MSTAPTFLQYSFLKNYHHWHEVMAKAKTLTPKQVTIFFIFESRFKLFLPLTFFLHLH